MKESKTQGERQKIFSCYFNDEQSVRAQGGVPSNVTFSNGVANFTSSSSKITQQFSYGIKAATNSVRIKFYYTGVSGTYKFLYDCRKLSAGETRGYIACSNASATLIASGSGVTVYVNSVLGNNLITNAWNEVVVTGLYFNSSSSFLIGQNAFDTTSLLSYMEFFEVYNYILTAQEVSNLYNNSRYRDVKLDKDEQLGSELVVNGSFTTDTDWTKQSSWTIHDGKAYYDDVASHYINPSVALPLTVGKRYRVTFDISGAAANARVSMIASSGSAALDVLGTAINLPNGSYSYTGLCINTTASIRWYGWTSGDAYQLDNLSIKEITCEYTKKILDVNAIGGISNSLSGNVYTELLGAWYTAAYWTSAFDANWSQSGSTLVSNGNSGNITKSFLTTGKQYRCVVCIIVSSGNIGFQSFGTGIPGLIALTSSGIYGGTFVAGGTSFSGVSNLFNGTITYLSIKEVIPSVVNTSTTVQKDGDVNAMIFNGSTSKLDCGSYDTLVGDKTFVQWVKTTGWNSVSDARIIENGKSIVRTLPSYYRFSSDGSTYASSAASSLILNKWQCIVVTRTSTGIINFYIDGVLSGTANQSSGTPAAGTNNIIIGNNNAGARCHKGSIDKVRVIDGILTLNEISEIYSSERKLYNV